MLKKLGALSIGKKIGLGVLALFVLLIGIGATSPKKQTAQTTNAARSGQVQGESTETKKEPLIETKNVTTTEDIPYSSGQVNDSTITKGQTKVVTAGKNGVRTKTFEVKYEDGTEKSRVLIKDEVTTPVVNEVVAVGTKVAQSSSKPAVTASNCDPNYSGACVPIASDVDCAGGSGNGPAYIQGPVTVIGTDIYKLDTDGDGIGCE